MKKILSIISVLSLFLLYSCEKNVITYDNSDLDQNAFAQVRLVYDLPLVTSATHNITLLKYNDKIYSQVGTALGSILPNSIARYHRIPVGTNKVDAFKGAGKDVVAYSSNFTIAKGKWSAFVYKDNEPPLLVQDPEDYQTGHPWNDTVAYIRFVNLFHKADGVTPFGRLTLKGVRTVGGVTTYIDIATADYKGATDYIPYKLNRQGIIIWSGTESNLVFALFDANGQQLTHFATTAATTKTAHSVTGYSLAKGVNYIFHLNGKEGTNNATQSIRVSTIAVN
ncbi:MAG: hypothetical protein Q8S23_06925 [Bacteroidales bacterium]|nr:hypothetical protein [Bacteroidales bacterium]